MQMDIGLDTGDMLLKAACDISTDETSGSLHDKLAELGCPALVKTLSLIATGAAKPEPQDDTHSCYASKINKAEQLINWSQPAAILARKIRAFNPFPVAYTTLGKDRIKIWQAEPSLDIHGQAGTIIQSDKDGIVVGCGEGGLRITHLQLPGGKALGVAAVMNSRADWFAVGVKLGAGPQ